MSSIGKNCYIHGVKHTDGTYSDAGCAADCHGRKLLENATPENERWPVYVQNMCLVVVAAVLSAYWDTGLPFMLLLLWRVSNP